MSYSNVPTFKISNIQMFWASLWAQDVHYKTKLTKTKNEKILKTKQNMKNIKMTKSTKNQQTITKNNNHENQNAIFLNSHSICRHVSKLWKLRTRNFH